MASEQDAAFRAVENETPNCLTRTQIDHYNEQGFISPVDGFSADEAVANRAYFDKLISQIDKRNAYAINCYQARLAGLWDLCMHPILLDHVEDLLGPDIVCWASHFFCKMPSDPKRISWHQDASYWHLSPTRTVTVWLAIDDADEENSALEFLPATHCRGSLPHRNADENSVVRLETAGVVDTRNAFSNNLKAGQFSVHADMLVHGSRPNHSDRRRCGLTIRYCPSHVRMTNDRWACGVEAIICRGTDRQGYWNHHARPRGDELKLNKTPVSIGGN